eukprot:565339-Alexandrium_andersonii.AAC.1
MLQLLGFEQEAAHLPQLTLRGVRSGVGGGRALQEKLGLPDVHFEMQMVVDGPSSFDACSAWFGACLLYTSDAADDM